MAPAGRRWNPHLRSAEKRHEREEFLAAMPLNPTGKVDRVKLKRLAAEGHVPASAR